MRNTLLPLISLFISCFILFLGNGLINVLLPVRMGLDGTGVDAIGAVLSLYYVGMFIGAIYSKNLIKRAGHVRMFTGCVALGAMSILICSLFSDPIFWGAMRIVIGICNACAFTAMESWLGDSSDIKTRGKVLATYNAVALAGLFGGQFFMNIANPIDTTLFVIAGILLCAATIPIGLSTKSGPVVGEVDPMPLRKLYNISPLGIVSCLMSGLIYSALFNMLPVFASHNNIVEFDLSIYMGVAIFGAFLLQFPIGYLSDRYDRRTVLLALLLVSAVSGLAIIALTRWHFFPTMFVVTGITCGIVACIYPLSIAEAFDRLKQSEMVAAMGSMILAFSVGGALGPISASFVMSKFGASSLFYFLAIIQLLLAGFVVFRMVARTALPVAEQEHFVMQSAAVSPSIELDPRSEYVDTVRELSPEGEIAVEIATVDPATAVNMTRALSLIDAQLGLEAAAAIAKVQGIDVLRLFEVMMAVLPGELHNVTRSLITAKPEFAYEIMLKLGQSYPALLVEIAEEIGHELPDLRVVTAKAVMEIAPDSALEMAEYYAQLLADEHESVRPAEREDDHSKEFALNISAELWAGAADQALDVAVVMADAIPESAVSLAQEYIASNVGNTEEDSSVDSEDAFNDKTSQDDVSRAELTQNDSTAKDSVELVTRFADAAPQQAIDVAVAVVTAVPDSAADVAAVLATTISERQTLDEASEQNIEKIDGIKRDEFVELVHRIREASPDSAMDVAVAVVEQAPASAVDVAADYAGTILEDDTGGAVDHDEAVELVQRLSSVSPDQTIDVAVAVVEAIPGSASEVVDAISRGEEPGDGEWMNEISDKNKG